VIDLAQEHQAPGWAGPLLRPSAYRHKRSTTLLYPILTGFVFHISTLNECLRHLTSYCPDPYNCFYHVKPKYVGAFHSLGFNFVWCFSLGLVLPHATVPLILKNSSKVVWSGFIAVPSPAWTMCRYFHVLIWFGVLWCRRKLLCQVTEVALWVCVYPSLSTLSYLHLGLLKQCQAHWLSHIFAASLPRL